MQYNPNSDPNNNTLLNLTQRLYVPIVKHAHKIDHLVDLLPFLHDILTFRFLSCIRNHLEEKVLL